MVFDSEFDLSWPFAVLESTPSREKYENEIVECTSSALQRRLEITRLLVAQLQHKALKPDLPGVFNHSRRRDFGIMTLPHQAVMPSRMYELVICDSKECNIPSSKTA